MASWGLQFGNELVECPARILPPKTIIQCNPTSFVHNGDWSTQVRSKILIYIYIYFNKK